MTPKQQSEDALKDMPAGEVIAAIMGLMVVSALIVSTVAMVAVHWVR